MQRRLVDKLTAAVDQVETTVKQGGDLSEAKQVSRRAQPPPGVTAAAAAAAGVGMG